MSSGAISTLIKMMESLPDETQNRVVEHVRAYMAEIDDEQRWTTAFQRSQQQLASAARRAKQEIAGGRAEPMDLSRL